MLKRGSAARTQPKRDINTSTKLIFNCANHSQAIPSLLARHVGDRTLISLFYCRLLRGSIVFVPSVTAAAIGGLISQHPSMATSVLHTASQPYPPPPPPFSQESTGSSLGGAHLSQGAMQSFDGTRSMASTPTPTTPASRGHHQLSSFNTTAYPVPNGIPIQQAPPKRYHESNGIIHQHQHPPGHKPQIYTVRSLDLLIYIITC